MPMHLDLVPHTDPNQLFNEWFKAAEESGIVEPNAMTLATCSKEGWVSARIVLLKQHNSAGFSFFTNYDSAKSKDIFENPKAALVFHWRTPVNRQVRIEGMVEKMSYEDSDSYFQTRPRGSQIGAWASPQSDEIISREELEKRVKDVTQKYEGQKIPCPTNWGGFRICPYVMEFWQTGDDRLHDRFHFARKTIEDPWVMKRLAP